MMNFCTLFDSNYIDKALALYYSLEKVSDDFRLYIMCFDDKSYDILQQMSLNKIIADKLEEMETPELLSVKQMRSKAEYCWTCTPATIDYFFKKYNLPNCIYIDADLYFFADPKILIDEIENSNSDIAIIEHRFAANKDGEKSIQCRGKYCVEFNYFNNSVNAINALSWWKQSCIDWCYSKFEAATDTHPARYGDQKYLEQFAVMFDSVHEIRHMGAGVAPWNLRQYKMNSVTKERGIELCVKATGEVVPLVFYHFQNLKYISKDTVNINSQCGDKDLKYPIYYPYLLKVSEMREMLAENYGLSLGIRKSYSSNKLKAFIQKYIMPFRLRSISDVIRINKIPKTYEQ